jgi:hypothetical protein
MAKTITTADYVVILETDHSRYLQARTTVAIAPMVARARRASVILADRMCEKRVGERIKIYDRQAKGLYVDMISSRPASPRPITHFTDPSTRASSAASDLASTTPRFHYHGRPHRNLSIEGDGPGCAGRKLIAADLTRNHLVELSNDIPEGMLGNPSAADARHMRVR